MVSMHCVHMESYLQTYLTNKNMSVESQDRLWESFSIMRTLAGLEG